MAAKQAAGNRLVDPQACGAADHPGYRGRGCARTADGPGAVPQPRRGFGNSTHLGMKPTDAGIRMGDSERRRVEMAKQAIREGPDWIRSTIGARPAGLRGMNRNRMGRKLAQRPLAVSRRIIGAMGARSRQAGEAGAGASHWVRRAGHGVAERSRRLDELARRLPPIGTDEGRKSMIDRLFSRFSLGFGVGYVVGARAGRERYQQILGGGLPSSATPPCSRRPNGAGNW